MRVAYGLRKNKPKRQHLRILYLPFDNAGGSNVSYNSTFITRMRVYHQYAVLYIISVKGAVYHQTEAFLCTAEGDDIQGASP